MNIVVLHGVKLNHDGSLSVRYKARISCLLNFMKNTPIDLLIITGGKTRRNLPTEASAGAEYVASSISAKTILIENTHSFIDDINSVYEIIKTHKYTYERIYVICDEISRQRLKYLYGKLIREKKNISFIFAKVNGSVWDYLIEKIYYIYSKFDIHQHYVSKFTLKWFRNK